MTILAAVNPVTKWLAGSLIILGLLFCAVSYGAYEQYQTLSATRVQLTTTTAELLGAKERIVLIQKQVQAEMARADANKRLLRNALKENAEWAAGRVPKSVADSLCKRGLCASGSPTAVPKAVN